VCVFFGVELYEQDNGMSAHLSLIIFRGTSNHPGSRTPVSADTFKWTEDRTVGRGARSVYSGNQLYHEQLAALAHVSVQVRALLTL
jgi:hypothetical protein